MHVAARSIALGHDESKTPYFIVWGGLLFLTAVEVVLAYKQVFTPLHMLEVLMVLSVVKSVLIIGYFMHLKYEVSRMKWLTMCSVVACLILMTIFFFPDARRILELGVK